LRLEAPAKLNLDLTVVGRRPDGHHLLESTLVLVELADRLLLSPGAAGLRVEGPEAGGLPVGAGNLAWRGLVLGLGHEPHEGWLALEKRVPTAAGLGGGSSDAAAAWRLARAWRGIEAAASEDDLEALSRIGADVPFFAAGLPAARVLGIGERVEARPPIDRLVVLVHPEFGLSTAAVFAELRREDWGGGENDLLAPAWRLRPELESLAHRIRVAGGEPQLSGSGPTLFSLTDDPDRAAAIAAALTREGVHATITRTRSSPADIEPVEQEAT
jgi:4-diphosphocytidyl-2-C-methyl-D-erythritol kinase